MGGFAAFFVLHWMDKTRHNVTLGASYYYLKFCTQNYLSLND